METKRILKIIVASPGDVQSERDALPSVIDELNRGIASERGLRLELSRWETDSYPGFHPEGPQGLIDQLLRIEDSDILIGIFWKRFGTPTKDAQSGTQHEVLRAYEAWKEKRSPEIMLYFNQKAYAPTSTEELDQWRKVFEFQQRFPSEGLWWAYKSKSQFERLVRIHLTQLIRRRYPVSDRSQPSAESRTVETRLVPRTMDELAEAYRASLAEKVNKVYLVGENQPRELEQVFVELDIIEDYKRPIDHAEFLGLMDAEMRRGRNPFARENQDESIGHGKEGGESHKRTIKPEDLLKSRTQVIVTGAPGCGKTTLLRYLTLKSLGNKQLPLFLELKTVTEADFHEARNDLSELLFAKAAATFHLQPAERERFKEFFLASLSDGEIAIFLDGLDEVNGTMFPALCTAVTEFARSFRNNILVISTRSYALHARVDELKEMEIAPLNQRGVEKLLKHYFAGDNSAKQLLQQLRRSSLLRELARVPFLLMAIAQLQRSQNQIVENRLDLYRQIVQLLAVKLDSEKSLPLSHFHITDPDGSLKLDFLKYLACERLLMGYVNDEGADGGSARLVFTSDAIVDDARKFLEREKRGEINPYLLAADAKATPLLREVGVDVYSFAHLAIQEYLAALVLSRRSDCDKVLCRAYFDPTLSEMEVLPMTLGLARKSDALFAVIEELPESLCFTNLRLRARALSYKSQVDHKLLSALTERLMEFVAERVAEETPYRNLILQDFSVASNAPLGFIIGRVASLLHSDETLVRANAAEALGRFGDERAVKDLLEVLHDNDRYVRWHVAEALGEIGSERVISALLETMKDEDHFVRRSSARALGQVGDKRAIPALLETIGDQNISVRSAAVEALGAIGGKRAIAALLEALNDKHGEVSGEAVKALHRLDKESALEALLPALKVIDGSVRANSAYLLGQLHDERTIGKLVEALADGDADVRVGAALGLGEFGEDKAVQALVKALDDVDSAVRESAAIGLGQAGSEKAIRPLLKALNDKERDVRASAAEALGWLGDDNAVGALLKSLYDEDRYVRDSAAIALGRIGGEGAVAALIEALKDEDSGVRFSAAGALGQVGGEGAVAALIETLRDESSDVRRSAADALGGLGARSAIEPLLEALKDEDSSVRMHTAEALGQLSGERAVAALLGVLKDEDSYVRSSAAEALGQMTNDVLSRGLVKALSGNNDFVRRKAAEVVGYYTNSEQVLKELSRLAATDPRSAVRTAASEAQDRFYRKLQYIGEVIPALPIAVEVGREQALEETRAFIAHEIKSTIGPLRMMAQILDENLSLAHPNTSDLTDITKRILKQTEKAYEVVNQYVDYTRPLTLTLLPTDLAALLGDVLDEFRVECLKRNIEIVQTLEPVPRADVDRTLIAQVLRNIILNAVEAMGRDGKLSAGVGQTNGFIVIRVSDTGQGIKAEHKPRLFELGFTTKLGKNGAGIGLALSRRIVGEAHNGRIEISNNPDGKGAVVTIELPLVREEQANGK
jgi:HEAT repeat protein